MRPAAALSGALHTVALAPHGAALTRHPPASRRSPYPPLPPSRAVTDAEGLLQPVTAGAPAFPLFLSGWVLPEEGPLPNAKGGAGTGRRVERLPLARVAERTQLSVDGVEMLLMRALSQHLIEGSIDQVDGVVSVTWVQPRVLLLPQVAQLRDKVAAWAAKVHDTRLALEAEAPELAVGAA